MEYPHCKKCNTELNRFALSIDKWYCPNPECSWYDINQLDGTNLKKRIEFIAKIRHIGWICYQIAANQPYNEIPNEDQLESLKQGVKYALLHPNMTAEENHENWMKMKASQGWVYGKVKDFDKKTHPDMVPFEDLPEIEKKKDIMDQLVNKLANNLWEAED